MKKIWLLQIFFAVFLISSVQLAAQYKYQFDIPKDKLPLVKDFVAQINEIQKQIDKGTKPFPAQLDQATSALQKFRPLWTVVTSEKLSAKDSCSILIELKGPSGEINLKRKTQPSLESKFFLTREKDGKWAARSTYYNWIEHYRNMGNIYVLIDVVKGHVFAPYASEPMELMPFLERK